LIRWLASALLFAAPGAWSGEAEWLRLLEASNANLEKTQRALESQFHLSDYERFDVAQDSGELVFSSPGKADVIAKVVFVGSYAFRSETWLWAWANSSINDSLTGKLAIVRKYGETHGLRQLTERGWSSNEDEGWELAAVVNCLLKGKGVYRAPSKSTVLWLVMTDVRQAR
jgi:hypothetical protein